MEKWLKISLILCSFGFCRDFRPSEPFVTEFLSGKWRNITVDQLNRDVYPVGTYASFCLLVFVFLVTDILRYKPIIIASACAGIAIWCLLLWTTSMWALQVVQVLYGFYLAAEVGYYTYMYAKVDKDKYQKVTGNTRSAILTGRFTASIVAQILVSFELMDFRELNYLTLGAQSISLLIAFMLPSVGVSMYFYSTTPTSENQPINEANSNKLSTTTDAKPKFSYEKASKLLWQQVCVSYSNMKIVLWSLWWCLASAGFAMVQIYVQILWQDIATDRVQWNAGVEAILTLFGAISAFLAGFWSKSFQKFDLWILMIFSLLQGIFIIISSRTESIWLAYAMYIIFGVFFAFMITIASGSVAQNLAEDAFALIFGINTFFSIGFQSILTFVVIEWCNFNTRDQFLVFGLYFVGLSGLFFIASFHPSARSSSVNQTENVEQRR